MENTNKLINELLDSKLANLWYSVNLQLSPIERDFKNRLNAFFSQQQKEVINNIKQNIYPLLDYDKYIDKFSNLYIDNVEKITNKAIKRVLLESNNNSDETSINQLKNTYILKYIPSISTIVINTTQKHLDKLHSDYKQSKITKQEFINQVNDYFNNECKKKRSKLISITETYRVYNFMYLNLMTIQGYIYKMYVARPNTSCPICSKLHKQKKLVFEDFDISMIDDKNRVLIDNVLFPPIHIQSKTILLCLRS